MAQEIEAGTIKAASIKPTHLATPFDMPRAQIAQDTLRWPIDLESLRVHDARQTQLPNAAASDDLGLVLGTPGTNADRLQSSDSMATSVTQYAAGRLWLPPGYDEGETVKFAMVAGMNTTIADGSATLDLEIWPKDELDYSHDADLYAGAAVDINQIEPLSERQYSLSSASLSQGQELNFKITVAIVDTAGVTAVIAVISTLYLLVPMRG